VAAIVTLSGRSVSARDDRIAAALDGERFASRNVEFTSLIARELASIEYQVAVGIVGSAHEGILCRWGSPS
jgi:hypothetical protein